MDLRTTASTRVAHAVANLQSQTAAIGDWQAKISSGKRLERPSQGPSDFVSLIDYKARDLRLSTSLGTISDATNDLNEGVSHLTEAGQVLTKAHALASDGANAATDGQQYEALASEVEGLLGRLIDLGNAKVGGRYLFGGTATTTQSSSRMVWLDDSQSRLVPLRGSMRPWNYETATRTDIFHWACRRPLQM